MAEREEIIERVVRALKEPVRIDPALNARVMSEIARLPAPTRRSAAIRSAAEWLWRRRTIGLSPIAGFSVAAAVVALALLSGRWWRPAPTSASSQTAAGRGEPTFVQFVLVAPGASSVTVVGDFNDWNASATPLMQEAGDGVWWATVPLTPGRYRYSFLVDGTTWRRDPTAAPAVEDEFGRTNSVITIGGA